MTVYGFWKNARDWVFGSFCLFWVFPLLVFLLYFAPNMKVAYWYYKNEILLAVSWKMRLDCLWLSEARKKEWHSWKLKKAEKISGAGQKKKKKNSPFLWKRDDDIFSLQIVALGAAFAGRRAVFPGNDSLGLMSNRDRAGEVSQERRQSWAGYGGLEVECFRWETKSREPRAVQRGKRNLGEELKQSLEPFGNVFWFKGASWIISAMCETSDMNSLTNWEEMNWTANAKLRLSFLSELWFNVKKAKCPLHIKQVLVFYHILALGMLVIVNDQSLLVQNLQVIKGLPFLLCCEIECKLFVPSLPPSVKIDKMNLDNLQQCMYWERYGSLRFVLL